MIFLGLLFFTGAVYSFCLDFIIEAVFLFIVTLGVVSNIIIVQRWPALYDWILFSMQCTSVPFSYLVGVVILKLDRGFFLDYDAFTSGMCSGLFF
jgi:hypothetical protein